MSCWDVGLSYPVYLHKGCYIPFSRRTHPCRPGAVRSTKERQDLPRLPRNCSPYVWARRRQLLHPTCYIYGHIEWSLLLRHQGKRIDPNTGCQPVRRSSPYRCFLLLAATRGQSSRSAYRLKTTQKLVE
jgi:hypothetical protein